MTPDCIPPFYYPTTVLFVDDNAAFLANLSLQLSSGLAYRLHSSPLDALLEINAPTSGAPAAWRYFSLDSDTGAQPLWRHAINLHLDKIHREVHNERRFGQIAVAVVDFDMPEIDGLAFCRNIKNPAVKKLLLTGKADEKIAVKAFNQGIIDRFIMKHETDATTLLNQTIAELQHAHFHQSERMLTDALAIGTHDFLRDPGFAGVFRDIHQQLRIVEYYATANPQGLLMLDGDGAAFLLVVQTEDDLLSQYEIAFDQAAPAALLDALKSGEVIPYFWQGGGHYHPDCADWRACLHPARQFRGKRGYTYAVIPNPPAFPLDTVVSFHAFLEHFDHGAPNSGVH